MPLPRTGVGAQEYARRDLHGQGNQFVCRRSVATVARCYPGRRHPASSAQSVKVGMPDRAPTIASSFPRCLQQLEVKFQFMPLLIATCHTACRWCGNPATAERLHGHLWSFPAQPVLGPCFSTGFGMTVIDRPPRPDRRRRSGRGGNGMV